MTQIYMTAREKQLTEASNQGKRAFRTRFSKPTEYANDPALSQAWDNGYRIAKEEYAEDQRFGWY